MGTNRIPREDLLDELRRLADGDAAPTQTEFREHGAYSVRVYQQRFGSWYAACVAAGLEPNRRPGETIDREDLLDELRRLADDLDRTPTEVDVDEMGKYSRTAYYNHFGGHHSACEAAGLEPNGSWYENRRKVQEAIGDVITGLDGPHEV